MVKFGYLQDFMIFSRLYMQLGIYSKPRNKNKLEFCTYEGELTTGMREHNIVQKRSATASFAQQFSTITPQYSDENEKDQIIIG